MVSTCSCWSIQTAANLGSKSSIGDKMNQVVKKIISGGQTGADQAGLEAGKRLGLETGGTAPPGWITSAGPQEEKLRAYGLVEGVPDRSVFRLRTIANVRNSDGTVWFGNVRSPGGQLTLNECRRQSKPFSVNPSAFELRLWLAGRKPSVLNIAGNRESTNPGIYERTIAVLMEALG